MVQSWLCFALYNLNLKWYKAVYVSHSITSPVHEVRVTEIFAVGSGALGIPGVFIQDLFTAISTY